MKTISKALVLIWLSLTFKSIGQTSQKYGVPLDSSGYKALFDLSGSRLSDWAKIDHIDFHYNTPNLIYTHRGKKGIISRDLQPLTKPIYNTINSYNDHFLAEKDRVLEILDDKGEQILLINNFLSFEKNEDYTKRSNLIIRTTDGVGILDSDFKWLYQPQFIEAFYLKNTIYIQNALGFQFIDKTDKIVHCNASSIGSFNQFIIETWDDNKRKTFYLKNGKKIPQSDSSLVFISEFNLIKVYQNGKAQLYDFNLNLILNYNGNDIFPLSIGMSSSTNSTPKFFAIKNKDRIGLVNSENQIILPFEYEHITCANSNRFIVMKEGLFGIVNQRNTIIVPIKFTSIRPIQEHFILTDKKQRGLVNNSGETIVPIEFDYLQIMNDFVITQKNQKYGAYLLNGIKVLDPRMDYALSLNGGIQFKSSAGYAMVNSKGLITPLNCQEIVRKGNLVKYYLADRIVMHNLEEESVVDTTIYPLKKSIQQNRLKRNSKIWIEESNSLTFQDQLTGKYGARSKHIPNYTIQPQLFNVIDFSHLNFGKKDSANLISFDSIQLMHKELIIPFNGNLNYIDNPHLALSKTNYSINDHFPILNKEFQWHTHFGREQGKFHYVHRPNNDFLLQLISGTLNFDEGNELMTYRDFFEMINSLDNFIIHSTEVFKLMASSPVIKIKNPVWSVHQRKKNNQFIRIGLYRDFFVSNKDFIILEGMSGTRQILSSLDHEIALTQQDSIVPLSDDDFPYFKAKNNSDWYLYDRNLIKVFDISFDEIEMISSGIFKLTNKSDVMYYSGQELIYHYSHKDSVVTNN
ncbi:WG repeat-containing protein [Crocinitomix algicola]|uniref:WG repeat-containing protein n=1 Tax=Crocinitomix algicola TaxID=1740263 RepID=UPI0008339AF9|nr:WG repeat-containing protein [Crocinitomix algicola]